VRGEAVFAVSGGRHEICLGERVARLRVIIPERIEVLVVEAPMTWTARLLCKPPGGDHNYLLVRDEGESVRHFARRVLRRTRQALQGARELTKITFVLAEVAAPPEVRVRLLRALFSRLGQRGVCRFFARDDRVDAVLESVDALSGGLGRSAGIEVRLVGQDGLPSPALARVHQRHDQDAGYERDHQPDDRANQLGQAAALQGGE
jgi:hypothetical protein